jgi:hypothetical protein
MKKISKSGSIMCLLATIMLLLSMTAPAFAWNSNSDQVWTNDYYNGLRAWSDFYFVVQNSVTMTKVVSNPGNCVGCWSIQFNAGNDRSSNGVNYQTNYPVQYQFIIDVVNYNDVQGEVDMLLPTLWTTCPSSWNFVAGTGVNYCVMRQNAVNTYRNLASSGTSFTLEPTVNGAGTVTAVMLCIGSSFNACDVWSTSISIPYSSGGHVFQNPYNAGQLNIVGYTNAYPSATFTYSGSNAGIIYVFSPDSGYYVQFASMYYVTTETSNLSYSWGYCPCGTSDNAIFK